MAHRPRAPLSTLSDLASSQQSRRQTEWAKAERDFRQHRNASAAFAHPCDSIRSKSGLELANNFAAGSPHVPSFRAYPVQNVMPCAFSQDGASAQRQSRSANFAALKYVQKPWVRIVFFLHSLLTKHKPLALRFAGRIEAMSTAAIFGAALSCIFVMALWFNYHGPIPSPDTSEQKDKTEQTDEKSKDKSEQQEKSEQKGKSSTKKAAKKKADACAENCVDEWRLRSVTPWPNDELRR